MSVDTHRSSEFQGERGYFLPSHLAQIWGITSQHLTQSCEVKPEPGHLAQSCEVKPEPRLSICGTITDEIQTTDSNERRKYGTTVNPASSLQSNGTKYDNQVNQLPLSAINHNQTTHTREQGKYGTLMKPDCSNNRSFAKIDKWEFLLTLTDRSWDRSTTQQSSNSNSFSNLLNQATRQSVNNIKVGENSRTCQQDVEKHNNVRRKSHQNVEKPKQNKRKYHENVEKLKQNKKKYHQNVEKPKQNKGNSHQNVEKPKQNKRESHQNVEKLNKGKIKCHHDVENLKQIREKSQKDVKRKDSRNYLQDIEKTKPEFVYCNKEIVYKCMTCCEIFMQIYRYYEHTCKPTDRSSAEITRYICHICGLSFKTRHNLEKHIKWHKKNKPFTCKSCYKRFTEKSLLDIHSRVHTGEKPYRCATCHQDFRQYSHLHRHLKRQHRMRLNNENLNENLWYKCDCCSRTFQYKSKLSRHMKIHTREKTYKCIECDQTFRLKHHLTRHVFGKHLST